MSRTASEPTIYRSPVSPDLIANIDVPPRPSDLWVDTSTNPAVVKKCTNASPFVWTSIEGGGGATQHPPIVLGVSGAGATVPTGLSSVWVRVSDNITITGWELVSDASCTIQLDVYRAPFASAPPTGGSIFSALPALSSAQEASASGLSIALNAGDYLRLNVSASPAPTATGTVSLALFQ